MKYRTILKAVAWITAIELADGNTVGVTQQLPAKPVELYRNDVGNDNNWIYLEADGWIYHFCTGKWLYLPEKHVANDGAWMYIPM